MSVDIPQPSMNSLIIIIVICACGGVSVFIITKLWRNWKIKGEKPFQKIKLTEAESKLISDESFWENHTNNISQPKKIDDDDPWKN